MTRRAILGALVALTGAACAARAPVSENASVVVDASALDDFDPATVTVEGEGVFRVVRSARRFVVVMDAASASELVIREGSACTVRVPQRAIAAGKATEVKLVPRFHIVAPDGPVGYGERFEIAVTSTCDEDVPWSAKFTPIVNDGHRTSAGETSWLKDVNEGPFAFRARMPYFDTVLGSTLPWGIVPISPRTRGEVQVLVAIETKARATFTRPVIVTAAARARGLPNVALHTRLYLGGEGWHVLSRPPGAKADTVREGQRVHAFTPDARGPFVLEDGAHRELRIVAGKYDETPLDCGRSDCHQSIAETARTNPMTTIFDRGLTSPFAGNYPSCAYGCHTAGDATTSDGGFFALATALGWSGAEVMATGFHDLPPALRRVSGAGCLGCHGPGAVPEPNGRWALLRADVCATCHDAPPRYGHVAAWRTSAMAHADADPRTREGRCAGCHTTWGFLGEPERRPPPQMDAAGITCAACHEVHPRSVDPKIGRVCAAALPRDAKMPLLLADRLPPQASKSKICVDCHTPLQDDTLPSASAAAIWLGAGGVDPVTGLPLSGPSAHAAVPGGCIGCHRAGPAELAAGKSHGFASDASACTACHAPKSDAAIAERARKTWLRLADATTGSPHHEGGSRVDPSTPRGRALYDVALVLEDRGAAAHNAAYARTLLDAVDAAIARGAVE